MNPEEIKIGETYNVRVKVDSRSVSGNFICASVTPSGRALEAYVFLTHEAEAFSPINPYPPLNLPTTNEIPETAPKYDPCRLFKERDKVREILVKGRRYDARYPECLLGEIATVEEEEDSDNLVTIRFANGMNYTYDAAYLELVAPVEELEPYVVVETTDYWSVEKGSDEFCLFWKDRHPHAKAAAEAECQRLNEEWRKEQK